MTKETKLVDEQACTVWICPVCDRVFHEAPEDYGDPEVPDHSRWTGSTIDGTYGVGAYGTGTAGWENCTGTPVERLLVDPAQTRKGWEVCWNDGLSYGENYVQFHADSDSKPVLVIPVPAESKES